MAESFQRGGSWWNQRPDGSWLKWNADSQRWEVSDFPPPPPDPPGGPPSQATPVSPQPNVPATTSTQTIRRGSPIQSFGQAAKVVLIIAVLVDVIATLSDLAQVSLVESLVSGDPSRLDEAESNDARQAALGGLQFLALIFGAIFFIRWMHRAYWNVRDFGATRLPHTPGWAIGAWFVPILNLFRPKQIIDATWKASDPQLDHPAEDRWVARSVPAFLHWWWAFWIIGGVLGWISIRGLDAATTPEQLITFSWLITAGDACSAAAGILAVKVVADITDRQVRVLRGFNSH